MVDLRDRYDRFAVLFAEQVRHAAEQVRAASARSAPRPGSAPDDYLRAVQDLFTRGVTPQGLRELLEHETRDSFEFFTREVELTDLRGRPWYERYPIACWRVFLAMAYRLNPARRVLFAVAVPLLLVGWWIYLLEALARGGGSMSFLSWEGILVAAGTLLLLLLVLELRDKLGLKGDLEVARQIQFGLLPMEPWARDGTSIITAMRPANTVGGDYFDIVELGGSRIAVVVGDVAGKGMPAALLMALLQGSLRTLLTAGLRGSELMAKLNAHLCANIPSNRLVTLFYAELALDSGVLSYVNAGHNPPILVRRDGPLERLAATAVALGVLSETPFSAELTTLRPGDRVLLYTDGVTEAENAAEQEYAEARLLAFLESHRADPPRALVDGLLANVLLHCGPVRPRDDMTLMSLSRD